MAHWLKLHNQPRVQLQKKVTTPREQFSLIMLASVFGKRNDVIGNTCFEINNIISTELTN